MIPESFIDDLTSRLDVVDVISRFVDLKKKGANYSGLCPFHQEKTPSFTVSNEKQFYHCFGCGAHGGVLKFVMEYRHFSFVETIAWCTVHVLHIFAVFVFGRLNLGKVRQTAAFEISRNLHRNLHVCRRTRRQ